jgi:hypothetical protein
MLPALIAAERDTRALAGLAKGKLWIKIPQLTEAMIGSFDAGHAPMAGSLLQRRKLVQATTAGLDEVIAEACRPCAPQIDLLQTIPGVGEEGRPDDHRQIRRRHVPLHVGGPSGGLAGLVPAIYESAGSAVRPWTRHGNKWLAAMPVEAAGWVGADEGRRLPPAQHARQTACRGIGRAAPA